MTGVELSLLDSAIVVVYLLGVTALGMWLSHGIHTSKDYFLAGKSLPWWAVGMSLVVTDVGAKDMVGLAADGYRYGMVMMNFDFIGCIFPVLIAGFVFVPMLWMAGIYTIPEYLGLRYNLGVRTFFAVAWTLFMVCTLGTIYVSAAVMFEAVLGWNFWFSVAVIILCVGVFTTVGGLKAVVITDSMSCGVLITGLTLICFFGLREVGGWTGLQAEVQQLDWTQNHLHMILPRDHEMFPWLAVLLGLGFVLGPAYWLGNQAIVQRTLGTASRNQARASYVFCAALKLVMPALFVIPGLIAVAMYHDTFGEPGNDFKGNILLPMLVRDLLPSGILGLVIGAFLAGVLSNLDSYVNSAATLLVTDLYKPFVRPEASDQESLRVGRILTVVLLIGGAAASYYIKEQFSSVFEAFQSFLAIFQGPLLATLLLGMLTRRCTSAGGVAGMLAGVATAIALSQAHRVPAFELDHTISYLWWAWWSFVAALTANILVSAFTTPYPRERLRGLVVWLPAAEEMKP